MICTGGCSCAARVITAGGYCSCDHNSTAGVIFVRIATRTNDHGFIRQIASTLAAVRVWVYHAQVLVVVTLDLAAQANPATLSRVVRWFRSKSIFKCYSHPVWLLSNSKLCQFPVTFSASSSPLVCKDTVKHEAARGLDKLTSVSCAWH